jgi:hypothetical protein|tara:strand:+ start:6317 stop:6508 length:192 start_codon:yes stop_codon:yes gene_type:complete
MSWEDILKNKLVLNYDDGSSQKGVSGSLTIADTGEMVALVLDGKIKKLVGKTITIDATDQSLD